MANEWVKVELYGANNDGEPRTYTIADGTSVSKGSLMQLTDPRTASPTQKLAGPIAGIAAHDKEANDGSTTIACWTNGIFEAVASNAILLGNSWSMAGAGAASENMIVAHAGVSASGASIGGYVLEETAASETVNVRLRL